MSRKDGGGGLEGEGNPGGTTGVGGAESDRCHPGWESKEQGRHAASAHGKSKCRWVVIGEGRGPV